ncbi:protein of unknown function [Vibrio tapetis subsp. tapetis]|uniref:Uncharacterized protein n=1 Tax=Vibrio tapetis subsp. tapetis TaxID=1671868 RepID=A0A2N8ZAX6_9VIBR|nr:protein of unknown function [Vibrio tapetis subsp. tapetis]
MKHFKNYSGRIVIFDTSLLLYIYRYLKLFILDYKIILFSFLNKVNIYFMLCF